MTDTVTLATRLGRRLQEKGWHIGTAESCTGGLLAAAITDVAGCSAWFDEGLVTYANHSKHQLLGVPESVLEREGAVSRPVVEAMVQGVWQRGAQVAVATSGIAGPDGGSPDKPVGTVWMGWGVDGQLTSECLVFTGSRAQVRARSVEHVLQRLLTLL